jgi:hypothetical protein
MPKEQWIEIQRIPDSIQAEILRGLLEAQGIQVWLSQEGAGRALGLSVSPMGEVTILVPTSQVEEAKKTLEQYYAGTLGSEIMDIEYPSKPED